MKAIQPRPFYRLAVSKVIFFRSCSSHILIPFHENDGKCFYVHVEIFYYYLFDFPLCCDFSHRFINDNKII